MARNLNPVMLVVEKLHLLISRFQRLTIDGKSRIANKRKEGV